MEEKLDCLQKNSAQRDRTEALLKQKDKDCAQVDIPFMPSSLSFFQFETRLAVVYRILSPFAVCSQLAKDCEALKAQATSLLAELHERQSCLDKSEHERQVLEEKYEPGRAGHVALPRTQVHDLRVGSPLRSGWAVK